MHELWPKFSSRTFSNFFGLFFLQNKSLNVSNIYTFEKYYRCMWTEFVFWAYCTFCRSFQNRKNVAIAYHTWTVTWIFFENTLQLLGVVLELLSFLFDFFRNFWALVVEFSLFSLFCLDFLTFVDGVELVKYIIMSKI